MNQKKLIYKKKFMYNIKKYYYDLNKYLNEQKIELKDIDKSIKAYIQIEFRK